MMDEMRDSHQGNKEKRPKKKKKGKWCEDDVLLADYIQTREREVDTLL